MKVICNKGYYRFYFDDASELRKYVNNTGLDLVNMGDHFTLKELADLSPYTLKGQIIQTAMCKHSIAGTIESVVAANEISLNFRTGLISNKETIVTPVEFSDGPVLSTPSLPQAFGIYIYGLVPYRVINYVAYCNVDVLKYTIEAIKYENL